MRKRKEWAIINIDSGAEVAMWARMNSFYKAKFNDLFMEFTRYLIEHPEFAENIPEGAQVVLLDRKDPLYSRQAVELSEQASGKDEVSDRPVVYIEVTQMAPVRSRLRELRVLGVPPTYLGE